MGIIRDSFVIFKNWAEAINALPEENQLETYKALVSYGLNGTIPKDISPIANAMLISFSTGMENNILRYNASVENGKKGGRPPKNKQEIIEETQQNLDIQNENLEKPSETQQNLEEPNHNLNVNDNVNVIDNVNDNVNDIELVKKNKKIKKNIFEDYDSARVCERVPIRSDVERAPYIRHYAEFFDYCFSDKFRDAAYEVIDTLIEAKEQSKSEEGLKFYHEVYDFYTYIDKMSHIDCDKFRSILTQIALNETIEYRPIYILGCLLTASETNSKKVSQEDLENFMKAHGVEYESKKNEGM